MFAAQLVQTIWPTSDPPSRNVACLGRPGVLPLDQFISEVLRRSRTSYSTLQIALYYLILLRPYLPSCDFTKEQVGKCAQDKTLQARQCGRRMFLAALILASKYLQDRNYSARAWSKISGLPTQEINRNELSYCVAVDWKLHFPSHIFERWSSITVRLCSCPPNAMNPSDMLACRIGWSTLIERLCASDALSDKAFDFSIPGPCQLSTPPATEYDSDEGVADLLLADAAEGNFMQFRRSPVPSETISGEPMKAPVWEPTNCGTPQPQLPPVPQLRNLPTPIGTPQPGYGLLSNLRRQPSMCSAMLQARKECMARATLDSCPPPLPCPKSTIERRSSISQSVTSLSSSPESMMSDDSTLSSMSSMSSLSSVSTRSSRSSSISSACGTLSQVRLEGLPPQRGTLPSLSRKLGDSAELALRFKAMPTVAPARQSDLFLPSSTLGAITESQIHIPKGTKEHNALRPVSTATSESLLDRYQRSVELEVAASLSNLRSGHLSPIPSNEATPQPRPAASQLESASRTQTPTQPAHLFGALPISQGQTPSTSCTRDQKVMLPARHKRTHSKANSHYTADMQNIVRMNLHRASSASVSGIASTVAIVNDGNDDLAQKPPSTSRSEAESPFVSPPATPPNAENEKASRSPSAPWAERSVPKACGLDGSKRRGCLGNALNQRKESKAVEQCRRSLRKDIGLK